MGNCLKGSGAARGARSIFGGKPLFMSSAAAIAMLYAAAPAYAQLTVQDGSDPIRNPGGQPVDVPAGVVNIVDDGDNIELEDNTNDGTVITVAGTLINNDTSDEDVAIFIDNSEDDVVITIAETGILRGVNGVIFQEGDGLTLTNNGLIEGTGIADEGVLYFDRDTDSALNTVTNNGTITNLGGGATIGIDALLDTTTITLVNTGTISNLNGMDDPDSDAINFNGDPGNTGGEDRGCLEGDGAFVLCQFQIDFTNSGTISAARDNVSNAAIRVEQDAVINGIITNQDGGTISGASNAIFINGAHSDHNLTISNAGDITGTSGSGILITGAGVTVNNLAGGVISGGDSGLFVEDTSITVDIGPSNLENVLVAAINNTFVNAGTISGTRASVDLSGAGEAVTFEQQGGGALLGDFLGTTNFTDMLNFTAGTGAFTLTNDVLQSVDVNVASGADVVISGARMIDGNLVSDGTLSFIVNSMTANTLAVTGDVTLNAGSFINVNGFTAIDQSFTLITSDGTLTNGATGVTDDSFLLDFEVVSTAPGSLTVISRAAMTDPDPDPMPDPDPDPMPDPDPDDTAMDPPVDPGPPPPTASLVFASDDGNIQTIGNAIVTAFNAGEFDANSFGLLAEIPDIDSFTQVATDLLPAINSGVEREIFETQRIAGVLLTDRLAGEAVGVWGQITYRDSKNDAQSQSVPRYDADSLLFTLGVDGQLGENIKIGLLGAYSDIEVRTDLATTGTINVDAYQLAAYLGYQKDNLFLNAQIGYSFNDVTTLRSGLTRPFTGSSNTVAITGTFEGDTNVDGVFGQLLGGFDLGTDKVAITPFGGLRYSNLSQDSFTENRALALNIDRDSISFFEGTLGLRVASNGDSGFLPYASIAYAYDFVGDAPALNASFTGTSNSFRLVGQDFSQSRVDVAAGVNIIDAGGFSVAGEYQGRFSADFQSQSFNLRFRYAF